jgi:poly(3-hydroxybutyrate) depolymerase
MLYAAYQNQSDLLSSVQTAARHINQNLQWSNQSQPTLRAMGAALETFSRWRLTHQRPAYGVTSITINQQEVEIVEEEKLVLPFGKLLHFRKADERLASGHPPVLLVAPLSGHFATLLRDTVRTLLLDHDVYVTDWHNARDVSILHGRFGLDDYITYLMNFMEAIGPGAHMVAVCQPCVAALAATALMAEDDNPAQPRTLTLMAGPVDCRINPTKVNQLATEKSIRWFEQNLLSTVPMPHKGFMRRVYPGFLQLAAFMNMNMERHVDSFKKMHELLAEGKVQEAKVIQDFYEEYFAVNDLPAEFYIETVQKVFQSYDLARGELSWFDRKVNTAAIRRTALLTVEGERDDICAVGQTMAAQDICPSVRSFLRAHHVQTGVGHYGVFSGRKWTQQIYPKVRDMIHARSH